MKIPVIEKFFCCVELRRACLGIGWGYGIFLVLGFVLSLVSMASQSGNTGGAIGSTVVTLISVGFCVLLVLGVQRDRPTFVMLGMYFLAVHAVLLFITSIINILSVGLIILFIYLPFSVYCFITVRSYWLQMTGSSSAPGAGA